MFNSILTSSTSSLDVGGVIVCMIVAIILGLCVAYTHMKTSKYSKNFLITLSLLPLLVEIVMMMVNGSLGTSVAVVGAFSLIRFRSIPGNSREILSVFFAMAIGLCLGMGQVWFAMLFTAITIGMLVLLSRSKFGENKSERILKIDIPENLDYPKEFNDVLDKYTSKYSLEKSKTINMGSMFELTYKVTLNDDDKEKELLDEIRVKNGNLKVSLSHDLSELEL